MKACFLILLSIFLLAAVSSQAQPLHITGKTRVHFTYDPIPYAYVLLMDKDSMGINRQSLGLRFLLFFYNKDRKI